MRIAEVEESINLFTHASIFTFLCLQDAFGRKGMQREELVVVKFKYHVTEKSVASGGSK